MLKDQPVTIYGSGEQVRDFVFVSDCARANLIALDIGSGLAYNLGAGVGVSVNQIYDHLKNITNYKQEAIYAPPKPGETFRIYLDAQKAKTELKWEPEVDLDDGLRKTVEYFKQSEVEF